MTIIKKYYKVSRHGMSASRWETATRVVQVLQDGAGVFINMIQQRGNSPRNLFLLATGTEKQIAAADKLHAEMFEE